MSGVRDFCGTPSSAVVIRPDRLRRASSERVELDQSVTNLESRSQCGGRGFDAPSAPPIPQLHQLVMNFSSSELGAAVRS